MLLNNHFSCKSDYHKKILYNLIGTISFIILKYTSPYSQLYPDRKKKEAIEQKNQQ